MKMNKKDLVKEFGKDLRLSNFTAAEIRFSSLAKADLRGAYFIKVVAPGVDFSGADLTDALMGARAPSRRSRTQPPSRPPAAPPLSAPPFLTLRRASPPLADRGVFVDANFKDAVLTRAVLTLCVSSRSPLGAPGPLSRRSSPAPPRAARLTLPLRTRARIHAARTCTAPT